MNKYKYPETKFTSLNNTARQLDHLRSEVTEAMEKLDINTLEEFFIEVCDIEHSLETLMRIIEKEAGGIDWDQHKYKVIKKNAAREYYYDLNIETIENWENLYKLAEGITKHINKTNNKIEETSELKEGLNNDTE